MWLEWQGPQCLMSHLSLSVLMSGLASLVASDHSAMTGTLPQFLVPRLSAALPPSLLSIRLRVKLRCVYVCLSSPQAVAQAVVHGRPGLLL